MNKLALVGEWISANYGWLHLLLTCAALVWCARKTEITWKIPAVYLAIMTLAYPVFYREIGAVEMYVMASFFELSIICAMLMFRHPMAEYIRLISWCCLVMHIGSLSAYYFPVALDVFGYHLTPLYDIKQMHKVIVPVAEVFQVMAIFAFSSPKFSHLDKPVQKEPMTWQAMSVHQ